MNEYNDVPREMPDSVQQRRSEQNVNPFSNLASRADYNELKTALSELEVLPFKDENQKTVFFENVWRLHGRHIIQIFKLGIVPLQMSTTERSQLLEDVMELFKICLSYCYTTDGSKRVGFEYYAKALKFCFPSQPKQCLSTAVVSKLLQVVQIFQEGKLASVVEKTEQLAISKIQINGTKHFFDELLAILETRRDCGNIAEIVDQTKRFASTDASVSCINVHVVGNVSLRSDHVVSPVLLTKWFKLLKLANVSSGFACALAKLDTLGYTKQCVPLFFPSFSFLMRDVYESTVLHFVKILEEMNSKGSGVSLPTDEERMGIFFKHINHFCQHRNATTTSLKLLATTSITNEVLREVLDLFFKEEEQPSQHFQQSLEIKAAAFDHVFKVLSSLSDGKLVNQLLKFWRDTWFVDPNYQHCACLMALFVDGSSSEDRCDLQERAERTLNFLHWLPSYLLRSLTFWYPFLASFIKAFPTSFQRRPEVLVFIHKAVLAAQVPAETCQAYVTLEQSPPREFLKWISQQSFTKEMKIEMIWLLMCCTDGGSLGHNWGFAIDIIKQLNLCQQLPFSTKKVVLRDLTSFAKLFKDQEKSVFRECVENVASNHTLELKDEIFFEILDFVKRFADKERPKKTIPSNVLKLLSLVSQIPISGDRRVKLLQMSKKSGKGLENSIRILETTWYGSDEENKHFDLLYAVFVDILKQESDLCEQFCEQLRQYRPSAQVKEVWSFEVAKLISLDSFKEDIDCFCCCHVLNAASGLTSPEMLQLISLVRSSAEKIVHLLREQNDIYLTPSGSDHPLEPFVSSLEVVVKSNMLSGNEKLLLVNKVCDIFVRCPDSLTEQSMGNALSNLISFSSLHDNTCSSKEGVVHLELNQIEAMLENNVIMAQLSRIPVNMYMGKSLSTVLSMLNSGPSSTHNVADIYNFIGSQEDLDQAFFDNLLSILEVAIQESKSVANVLEILTELVCILRSTRSELISFTILNFENLLKNQVSKQERLRFLNEVIMKWDFSPNVHVLTYLEVPRLLWKAYMTSKTPAERCGLIDRLQQVLKKANENVNTYCSLELCGCDRRNDIVRKVDCCELEWLVFHSSLSNDEVGLACNLIFRFNNQRLRCFTFYDVQIDEGCFKFVPQKSEPETADSMLTTAAVRSTGKVSPTTEAHGIILTPVSIAQKVILHLKRLLGQGEDPTEKAFLFWDRAFGSRDYCTEDKCNKSLFSLDDNVDVFLSILAEASSAEMVLHWINKDRHHICQCLEVVLKACKKRDDADDLGEEAMLNFQVAVSTTMENIRMKTPDMNPFATLCGIREPVPCFRVLKPQLKNLSNILEHRLSIEVTTAVLALFETNVQAGVVVGEIVSFWSCKQQSIELLESFKMRCQEEDITSLNPTHGEFVWQFLKAFGRICMNSCKDLLLRFKELMLLYDREDDYGFNRLRKWREVMIADGFSALVIDCWCVAFLTTPLKELSSRDVDAIVDLNFRSLQLVAPLSQRIKSCIFPKDGFQVTQGEGIKEISIKKRLRLARLLCEFINILKLQKPKENHKDAVIKTIVLDACNELCEAHENQNRRRNDLYKIHGQMLKALFIEVFGKQRKPDGDEDCADVTRQAFDEESRGELPVARQSSYLHESLPSILSHNGVYEPLLVLLRRWLSQIAAKPTLALHTIEIVQLLFSVHSSVVDQDLLQRLHNIIKDRILSLEQNQVLIAQLQASGYNQNTQGTLWSSSKLECSGYLRKCESSDSRRFKKKLERVLRPLWNEWKDILFMLGFPSIKVGETVVHTQDLFSLQASLEEMEKQVSAVKEEVLNQNKSRTEDLERSIKRLMRLEQQHRARIELYKSRKSSEAFENMKSEMKMFVAVWENRFLENVKLCSEQIPGCYAPNGFHSEKPVLCALSVDNRIVTVFKEDKSGRREEVENVEVKLMEAGMYVYGLHTSGHDYVTDELWAAFFKMLLDERLVPSIVLSNESPGFDWIKEYVKPVTSHPCPWKWELHQGIVPQDEDYFDYLPIQAALWPARHGLTEFVTLTRENVSSFQFKDFKDAGIVKEKEKRTKEMTGKAIQVLKNELCLLHKDDEEIRKAMVGKLSFAVKETIKSIIDGDHPTEDMVKELIDVEKLAYSKVQRTEESRKQYAAAVQRMKESRKQYAAAVLLACKTACAL